MYTKVIMGTEYGFTREEITPGKFCYEWYRTGVDLKKRRATLLYTLNYKGEDEEEILCELFLRYFDDYRYKSDQVTSKQMVDSYTCWYKKGIKER
jgi:hypothetical protein